jgi:AcrR family transcriptional regulator
MDQGYATATPTPAAGTAAAAAPDAERSVGAASGRGSGSGKRPLRRDAERNRLLILSAARTVFAQRGLEATLDEVAREAGLGVGTVYRRFPNRDALIDALFVDGIETVTRVIDQALAMPRAWDGLGHFMSSMLELQCQDKGLRDVMLSRRGPEPAEYDLLRDRIKPPLYDMVHRAQQAGDLRADLSATDIGVLEVAALGAAELTTAVHPDAWRRYLTIILDGMRARPEGGPHGNSPLDQAPLDDDQLDECMTGWKYGSRETPRHRA